MTEFRCLLSFRSFFKLMLIGSFCAGFVMMPINAFISASNEGGSFLGHLRIPSGALLTGLISALAGYPVYRFIAPRFAWARVLKGDIES